MKSLSRLKTGAGIFQDVCRMKWAVYFQTYSFISAEWQSENAAHISSLCKAFPMAQMKKSD
jgi:hypothetical protein